MWRTRGGAVWLVQRQLAGLCQGCGTFGALCQFPSLQATAGGRAALQGLRPLRCHCTHSPAPRGLVGLLQGLAGWQGLCSPRQKPPALQVHCGHWVPLQPSLGCGAVLATACAVQGCTALQHIGPHRGLAHHRGGWPRIRGIPRGQQGFPRNVPSWGGCQRCGHVGGGVGAMGHGRPNWHIGATVGHCGHNGHCCNSGPQRAAAGAQRAQRGTAGTVGTKLRTQRAQWA